MSKNKRLIPPQNGLNPELIKRIQNQKRRNQMVDISITGADFIDSTPHDTTLFQFNGSNSGYENKLPAEIAEGIAKDVDVYQNLKSPYIFITEDKANLRLIEFEKSISNRLKYLGKASASGSIALTLVTTFFSTTFKDSILNASTWEAIYIITGFFMFGYSIYCLFKGLLTKVMSIDELIEKMKKFR